MLPLPESDLQWVIEHASQDLDHLRGSSIFITGGTGFIGSWLVECLCYANRTLQLNLHLHVLTRSPEKFQETYPHLFSDNAVSVIKGDVRSFEYREGHFDYMIHAATESSAKLNSEQPLHMVDTITIGTRHALEFCRRANIKRMLFLSSGAVYGRQPEDLTHVPESFEGAPDCLNAYFAYAEAKRMAELLCALYARQYGMEIPVARLFAFLGPRLPLDAHFAAGNFLRDALAGTTIQIAGDGTAVRSYMYPAELIIWLLAIMLRGASCRAYNVGSDQAVSIRELANSIAAAAPTPAGVEVLGKADASNPVNYYVPNISRAKRELKTDIQIPLDKSIRLTLAALSCMDTNA